MELSREKKQEIMRRVTRLVAAYHEGLLGGEVMPEDENPGLLRGSAENYAYFTLPMALNYQRNSYSLWRSARQTYRDTNTCDVFEPAVAAQMDTALLREKLTAYKLALQPHKQTDIWQTLCISFTELFGGDIRAFFVAQSYSVAQIRQYVHANKRAFPYLGGEKLLNYWLYVLMNYTDAVFPDKDLLTVSPDTHIIQASVKLGLITPAEAQKSDARRVVAERWNEFLAGSAFHPLQVHTPLWLWSREHFTVEI